MEKKNKIIFLDIDGVLNSNTYFEQREIYGKNLTIQDLSRKYTTEDFVDREMYELDPTKISLLLTIIDQTKSQIIITSSYRRRDIYPYFKQRLINIGLPIIGETPIIYGKGRGEEILTYLRKHPSITDFIILDDEIHRDFQTLNLLPYLIKTDFYSDGLTQEISNIIIKKLNKKPKK